MVIWLQCDMPSISLYLTQCDVSCHHKTQSNDILFLLIGNKTMVYHLLIVQQCNVLMARISVRLNNRKRTVSVACFYGAVNCRFGAFNTVEFYCWRDNKAFMNVQLADIK